MNKIPKRTLIYDISNILFRVAAVQKTQGNPYARNGSASDQVGLCMHISLASIFKWYTKYKPDFVVFAFEGGSNWRKAFTADAKSRKAYKGNRVADPEMKHFYELMESFKTTMTAHTSICCISVKDMEADDVIAGYCQAYHQPDGSHEVYIISGDKDYTQLLKLPGVHLVNPDNGKKRNQPGDKDYQSDLDYWLFLKCVRGDMGDYVPSAFPRVREARIKKAYENEYEKINLMNERWTDENGTEHKVGDLFEENKILLSLFDQPEPIREKLFIGIDEQTKNFGSYSHFQFLRFLNDFELEAVREKASNFIDLFTNNQRFLKGEKTAAPLTPVKKIIVEPEPAPNKLLDF